MKDVVIIGGGHAGSAVGAACVTSGLDVLIIDECREKPEELAVDWACGRGVVSKADMVAVLDPVTADERQIVPAKAIVIAVGRLDPENPATRMLGITKLGAEFSSDGQSIITDSRGRTGARGVFAVGSSASTSTPGVVDELIAFCALSLAK